MYPFLYYDRKLIFWWSAKCGCTTVKSIMVQCMAFDHVSNFLDTNADDVLESIRRFVFKVGNQTELDNLVADFFLFNRVKPKGVASFHDFQCGTNLKINYEEASTYKNVLFLRHPFKRFVSGFFDKYIDDGQFIESFKPKNFMDALANINLLDKHHFLPQTSGGYINGLKFDMIFDIEKIDYAYLGQLLDFHVRPRIMHNNYSSGWSYNHVLNKEKECLEDMTLLPYENLVEIKKSKNVNWRCFENEKTQNILHQHYAGDFKLWGSNARIGIKYT